MIGATGARNLPWGVALINSGCDLAEPAVGVLSQGGPESGSSDDFFVESWAPTQRPLAFVGAMGRAQWGRRRPTVAQWGRRLPRDAPEGAGKED